MPTCFKISYIPMIMIISGPAFSSVNKHDAITVIFILYSLKLLTKTYFLTNRHTYVCFKPGMHWLHVGTCLMCLYVSACMCPHPLGY